MGSELPKQYLSLAGRPLLWHALSTLCSVPQIRKVFVVLAPDDNHWNKFDWSSLGDKLMPLRCGGATRAASVTNGLREIADQVGGNDWILVHDAARACLHGAHVEALMQAVGDDQVGGILAVPVADTLKQGNADGRIDHTVPRDGLWQAQTPQMFRHAMLLAALSAAKDVTDEASAIEALGHRPLLVAADASNLKVTWPQDMQLAELILMQREAT
ncbi:MAG: 2-C-methyl-D-erythritol 4-phosphate cytidylyltransferase [Verrucomicrobia bacterium]|nr:MAG: 2-C-methyl-D-erythritol 4-phosphate cytidylyltransferase [Verrucomicrobiota bacterium]